jgi:hypothetical protein
VRIDRIYIDLYTSLEVLSVKRFIVQKRLIYIIQNVDGSEVITFNTNFI